MRTCKGSGILTYVPSSARYTGLAWMHSIRARMAKFRFPSSLFPFEQKRQTFPAGHRGGVLRGDAFHLGPIRGFAVARVAKDHAVLIESVQVALGS